MYYYNEIMRAATESIPEEILEIESVAGAITYLESHLEEREGWLDPSSDRYQETIGDARVEAAEDMREAILETLRDVLYRREVLGFDTSLGEVYDTVIMMDTRETVGA